MGTSGAYTPSPKWSGTKADVTRALNDGTPTGQQAKDLVAKFVEQLATDASDGFGKVPSGFGGAQSDEATEKLDALLKKLPLRDASSPGAGRGTSSVDATDARGGAKARSKSRASGGSRGGARAKVRSTGGASVRPAAQRLAQFIAEVPKLGLRQALTNAGLPDVGTLKPGEIALAVADVLVADASQLITTELRDAVATVVEELCDKPESFAEAEQQISDATRNLESVVQRLFECYIMERFKTFFCEHESAKHGYEAADRILHEAREFISSEMELHRADKHDLTAVDWTGAEGAKIVDAILERTIAVYTD
jgi:hypothetical protein